MKAFEQHNLAVLKLDNQALSDQDVAGLGKGFASQFDAVAVADPMHMGLVDRTGINDGLGLHDRYGRHALRHRWFGCWCVHRLRGLRLRVSIARRCERDLFGNGQAIRCRRGFGFASARFGHGYCISAGRGGKTLQRARRVPWFANMFTYRGLARQ